MSKGRRIFSKDFKLQVLGEADEGVPVPVLIRRYQLSKNAINNWRKQLDKAPDNPFPGAGRHKVKPDSKKIVQMERMIGRLTLENDFLKNALVRLRESEK